MATRIVEQELEWCEGETDRTLRENGYQVRRDEIPGTVILRASPVEGRKGQVLRQLPVEVTLTRISGAVTSVGFSPRFKWSRVLGVGVMWISLGLLPFAAVIGVSMWFGREWTERHRSWYLLALGLTTMGCIAFPMRAQRLASKLDARLKGLERALWEHLGSTGETSHEVKAVSGKELGVWRCCRRVSWVATIIGCIMLVVSQLLPPVGSRVMDVRDRPTDVIAKYVVAHFQRPMGVFFGAVLACCGAASLTLSGWLASSYALPHRYHWKIRFGETYAMWCLVVFLPSVVFPWRMITGVLQPAAAGGMLKLMQFALVASILFLQGFGVAVLLRMVSKHKGTKPAEPYYAPPSTRYEALSEDAVGGCARSLFRRNRCWTWATFLVCSTLCYLAAWYLVVAVVENTAGILGAEWALDRCWQWPLLFPAKGRAAAVQSLMITCTMGIPLVGTVAQAIWARLRLHRAKRLARGIAELPAELDLPIEPLSCLKREANADTLEVAFIPAPGISVEIARVSVFKKEYFLTVSVGARQKLSHSAMEALLWHECGHASLMKRGLRRELLAVLAPWAPRFMDLAEDLYEREQQADSYAVQRMGDASPLISALRTLKREQEVLAPKGRTKRKGRSDRWISWDGLKMIWNLGWTGYLHPHVDERLRWLQDWSKGNEKDNEQ